MHAIQAFMANTLACTKCTFKEAKHAYAGGAICTYAVSSYGGNSILFCNPRCIAWSKSQGFFLELKGRRSPQTIRVYLFFSSPDDYYRTWAFVHLLLLDHQCDECDASVQIAKKEEGIDLSVGKDIYAPEGIIQMSDASDGYCSCKMHSLWSGKAC